MGAAKALGLDAGALAQARGLAGAVSDVDARFPHAAWLGLWQDIIERTGSESIGIDAAERLPWGHFEVIDYLVGTSEDLGSALRRFERYFAIVSTGVAHELEEHGDSVHLVRRYAPDCYTRLLAPAEFSFASVMIRTRIATGAHWVPRAVHFAAPPPRDISAQRRLFGCPIEFNAALSAIVMERATLALPMRNPDPELIRILERHAELLVGQVGSESDVIGRVQRIIMNALPDAEVSIAQAARKLGMSVRTLQRRLQESGQSFDELFDSTRRQLARRYLGDPALSIQETAHLLAFGDLRGFYRAFRRWEGCTPAEFRRAAGAAQSRAGAPSP
jgi:AraC-like DNA-binding protein